MTSADFTVVFIVCVVLLAWLAAMIVFAFIKFLFSLLVFGVGVAVAIGFLIRFLGKSETYR